MLTIHKDSDGQGSIILKLAGDATVESGAELQSTLIDALQNYDRVMIDCEQLGNIDFYVIQMLCSAHRTSVVWKKELIFHGQPGARLNEKIRLSGFARERGCSLCPDNVRCMWIDSMQPSEQGTVHA